MSKPNNNDTLSNEKTSLLAMFGDSSSSAATTAPRHVENDMNDNENEQSCKDPIRRGWFAIRNMNWRWGLVIVILVELVLVYHYGLIKKTSRLFKFNPGGMPGPYNQIQVLGFQIHTGGGPAVLNTTGTNDSGPILNPECYQYGKRYGLLGGMDSDEPEFDCYLGLDDPMEDAKKRVQIMKDAVEAAYDVADSSTSTLKIFIAPEFFFRGRDGAYRWEDENDPNAPPTCGPICTILEGLEDLVADKRYEDWMFLFGSIIAYEDLPESSERTDFDYLFYNFAPIYKGYDPEKTNFYGKRYILPKRYTSTLDFLTPQRYVNESFTTEVIDTTLPATPDMLDNPFESYQAKYDVEVWQNYRDEIESLGYTMIEYDWIIMDDIIMSIEICFDHFRGRALETYLANIMTGGQIRIPSFSSMYDELTFVPMPNHLAQVSLVSSSGMTISPTSFATTNNGTLYLQDGLYDDDAVILWRDPTTQDRIDETLGGSEAITRTAVITPTDTTFHYDLYEVTTKASVYNDETTATDSDNGNVDSAPAAWQTTVQGVFSTALYEPMIVIWDPRDIPTV